MGNPGLRQGGTTASHASRKSGRSVPTTPTKAEPTQWPLGRVGETCPRSPPPEGWNRAPLGFARGPAAILTGQAGAPLDLVRARDGR